MMQNFLRKSGLFFLLLIIVAVCPAQQIPDSVILFDFEQPLQPGQLKTAGGNFRLVTTTSNKYLQVQNGADDLKPGVKLFGKDGKSLGVKGFYQIKADVSNLSDEEMQIEMFVGNDPDGLVRWYCSNYIDVQPGETKTLTVDLSWTPWVFHPQPELIGMRGAPGIIKTNLDAIKEITFNARYPKKTNVYTVDNVRAVGRTPVKDTAGFFPFIDVFGQYKHKEWPGKVHSLTELQQRKAVEEKALAANASPAQRNKYGGWTGGPQLKATGFFRTEKYNGKWWMVDPEGRLFWSAGVNCVLPGNGRTAVQYREHYFENLPAKNGEYAPFYGKGKFATHGFYMDKPSYETFNFYEANLYRKYGPQWLEQFREAAHRRLRSWGLNTIGFVSESGLLEKPKTPYVGSIWIRNTPKIAGTDGYWGPFHDVFDPAFRQIVRQSVAAQKQGANDPWCIGFFVDNELSWGKLGSLAIGTLKSPATQAAKKEFINDLKQKYRSINALNKVWGTQHASWQALLQSTKVPDEQKAAADLHAFYNKIAQTYFRTIHEELKQVAPNQNYLGCRFAWASNDVMLRAAAQYCDIISFNKYEYSVANVGLPKGIDKPVLIGEFHFGALDRGVFHVGIREAENQEDRGRKYQSYIQSALNNPQIVGAHWFQFSDEPVTGRSDGENYNVGLVDVCDNPYPELIEKMRETNWKLYEYRMKSTKTIARQ